MRASKASVFARRSKSPFSTPDHPILITGTDGTVTSWELGGRHFWHLLGTFVLGSVPIALPLLVGYQMIERFGPVPLSAALVAASWQLGWVGVQSTRGLLIPTLHTAYEDLYVRQA